MPFPLPGDLPDPGIEPGSATLRADSFPSELQGKIIVNNAALSRRMQSFLQHSDFFSFGFIFFIVKSCLLVVLLIKGFVINSVFVGLKMIILLSLINNN